MSNISPVSGYVPPAPATKTNFETNSRSYGPVVASIQGVGDAIVDGASAIVNFSEEGIQKLGDSISSGVDSVEETFSNAGQEVSDAVASVENSAVDLYHEVADMAENSWNSIKAAAHDAAAYVGLVDDKAV
jgi:phage-related protein